MTETYHCPVCQTALPPSAPEGFCPVCEFRRAVNPPTGLKGHVDQESAAGQNTGSDAESAPSLSDLAKLRYFGEYELLEEIAEGGMGTVFKARQLRLNRLVALKVINAGMLASHDLVKRFKTEAETAAGLAHPAIVPIHEIGEFAGHHYFSMGFIDGPTLGAALGGRPMPTREAAGMLVTLARAVHFAHQRGVLHRDVKPGNVLLDGSGRPHLTDFGLAKLLHDDSVVTQTRGILGTPAYMSPEQARGDAKAVTTAGDVYGLGAVFYEMLTGCPPFEGRTPLETIHQVLEQEPRRPSLLNRQVDRDLETICLKCLEKEPSGRYGSADALGNDLERWMRHEPILARPSTALTRVTRWARRKPAVAGLLVAVLVVLAAGLAGVFWQWDRAERFVTLSTDQLRREVGFSRLVYAAGDRALARAATELESGLPQDDVRRGLLESALVFYRSFLEEKEADPRVRREAAQAHLRMGSIHLELEQYDQARSHFDSAIRLLERMAAEDSGGEVDRVEMARAQAGMADATVGTGQFEESVAHRRKALELYEALFREMPGDPTFERAVVRAHADLGEALRRAGRSAGALNNP